MFTRLHEEKANGKANGSAPLDVGAAFEAMTHEGADDTSVHLTQLKSTASLLNGGMATEEVVREVMGATKRAGKPTWDYDEEERKVLKLCFDWITKNPNLAYLLPEDLRADFNTKIAAGCTRVPIRWLPFKKAWDVVGSGGVETECTDGLPPLLGGFVPYNGDDIAPAEWIIKGLLPATGVLILPGQWGTYKTTLVYEMAFSIPYRRAIRKQIQDQASRRRHDLRARRRSTSRQSEDARDRRVPRKERPKASCLLGQGMPATIPAKHSWRGCCSVSERRCTRARRIQYACSHDLD
jgi:hypothetical protein